MNSTVGTQMLKADSQFNYEFYNMCCNLFWPKYSELINAD